MTPGGGRPASVPSGVEGADVRRPAKWRKIWLAGAATAFALLLTEGALAFLLPQPIHDIYVSDPVRGHRLERDAVRRVRTREYRTEIRTNSLGIRDRDLGAKRPGERRVLCLGDSFTHGAQVAAGETFVEVLESSLRADDGDWEAVNAGIPGYETAHERVFLHNDLWPLRPDVVLVCFFQNDVVRQRVAADGDTLRFVDDQGAFLPAARWDGRIRNWLCSRSHLYYLVWRAARDARLPDRAGAPEEADETSWRETEGNLAAIAAECRERDVPLGVVVIPWRERVLRGVRDPYDVHRRVPEACARIGVPCLDLLPAFLADGRTSLYFQGDGHFAPDGHVLAAREIEGFMRREGWVQVE